MSTSDSCVSRPLFGGPDFAKIFSSGCSKLPSCLLPENWKIVGFNLWRDTPTRFFTFIFFEPTWPKVKIFSIWFRLEFASCSYFKFINLTPRGIRPREVMLWRIYFTVLPRGLIPGWVNLQGSDSPASQSPSSSDTQVSQSPGVWYPGESISRGLIPGWSISRGLIPGWSISKGSDTQVSQSPGVWFSSKSISAESDTQAR